MSSHVMTDKQPDGTVHVVVDGTFLFSIQDDFQLHRLAQELARQAEARIEYIGRRLVDSVTNEDGER